MQTKKRNNKKEKTVREGSDAMLVHCSPVQKFAAERGYAYMELWHWKKEIHWKIKMATEEYKRERRLLQISRQLWTVTIVHAQHVHATRHFRTSWKKLEPVLSPRLAANVHQRTGVQISYDSALTCCLHQHRMTEPTIKELSVIDREIIKR